MTKRIQLGIEIYIFDFLDICQNISWSRVGSSDYKKCKYIDCCDFAKGSF